MTICAALLSIGVETIQLWSVDRFSSPYDVLSNVLGALIGAQAWRRLAPQPAPKVVTLEVTRAWIATAATAAALLVMFWNLPTRSSALETWDETYPLQLGNERTGDRPWRGTITALSVFPSAFTRADVLALGTHLDNEVQRPAAYVAPNPVTLDGGTAAIVPAEVSRTFAQQAMHHDAFTVIVQFETASLLQEGPARIVSFSNDPFHRNFDLGQETGKLVFRIRTPVTGPNGTDYYHAETPSIARSRAHLGGCDVRRRDRANLCKRRIADLAITSRPAAVLCRCCAMPARRLRGLRSVDCWPSSRWLSVRGVAERN